MTKNDILLARIDERVEYLAKTSEVNTLEIKAINVWRNRSTGIMLCISTLAGYGVFF